MPGPLGAVVALAAEAGCLAGRRCRAGERVRARADVLVQVAGLGAERARHAAEALLTDGAGALLSFGVAAGLAPGLLAGTMLLPEHVIAADGRRLATDVEWHARWSARAALTTLSLDPVAETCEVLLDAAAKRALAARTGAVAADMESAAVLSVAAAAGVPALVVRCVLDPVTQTVPGVALAAMRADGSTDVFALGRALVRHPQQLLALPALAFAHRRALAALTHFANAVLDVPFAGGADDAARSGGQNLHLSTGPSPKWK